LKIKFIEENGSPSKIGILGCDKSETRRGADRLEPRHQERDSSYSDLLEIHPLVFNDAMDSLEADNWLYTMESKFGLL
jgi:hypothetical protein